MVSTAIGVALIAAVASLGDAIWYGFGVQHTVTAGVIHGALLLTIVGAVIGAASGHAVKGLPIGMLAGVAGAVFYYAVVPLTDGQVYGVAIPLAWIFMWLVLATLDGRWLRAPARRSWSEVATRGLIAAIGGGLAFYLVMNTLWGRPPAAGRNYALQFLAWAFAWTPGLLALTAGSSHTANYGTIESRALADRIARGETPAVLDVRSPQEFASGHVPGAVNIPFQQVSSRLSELPGRDTEPLIVYCGHGPRAYIAARSLQRTGRTLLMLRGHWSAWQSADGRPITRNRT